MCRARLPFARVGCTARVSEAGAHQIFLELATEHVRHPARA
jgi:hypothetical protein